MPRRFKKRLNETLISIQRATDYLSSKIKTLFSKTLVYLAIDFSMDNFFFNDPTDDIYAGRKFLHLSDVSPEQLYLVDHRWWNEVRKSYCAEVNGVCYHTEPSIRNGIHVVLFLRMRKENIDSSEEGFSGREYALVSEWMFLRALRGHNNVQHNRNFLRIDSSLELLSLQIRLSVLGGTNPLVVKISQKDNIRAFDNARKIFCVESGTLRIWDFSGQTSQLLLNDRTLSDDLEQPYEEILLELLVFDFLYYMNRIEEAEAVVTVDNSNSEGLNSCGLKMNGNTESVVSYNAVRRLPSVSGFTGPWKLGLTGLCNLGNTCFMNSAIQCLVHTPELVDYFLGDFRKDLNFGNPLGMNGKLALAFGDLSRKLWAPGAFPVAPRVFKSTLSGFAPQFSGYQQHDSQEFLAFLLDGLHEDLNRVQCKPYLEVKDADGRPDVEVADEHWRVHRSRNDSIIVDLCQGQYRSTLVCPDCKKVSITFDPFMYLSLPLPSTSTRTLTLTIISTDGTHVPFPVTVTVPKDGIFEDLVKALITSCSLREDETLLVAEVYNHYIFRVLENPSDSLSLIRENDMLVAYRLPKTVEESALVEFVHLPYNQAPVLFYSCAKGFGIPLLAGVSDFPQGSELRKKFAELLRPFLLQKEELMNEINDDVIQDTKLDDIITSTELGDSNSKIDDDVIQDTKMDNVISTTKLGGDSDDKIGDDIIQDTKMDNVISITKLEVGSNGKIEDNVNQDTEMDDVISTTKLEEGSNDTMVDDDFQFILASGERQIQMNDTVPVSGSQRVRVYANWSKNKTELSTIDLFSSLPTSMTRRPRESASLYKCLDAFLKEEPLGPEDMWYCPTCKKHQQASKKLDLWRLPEILVIHLKRFSFNLFSREKLETFVDFPVDDFDFSSYVVQSDSCISHHYKLYAVINHYGFMGGGHYTAVVQHENGGWYEFNDSHVVAVREEDIKSPAAYVLFYRRIPDADSRDAPLQDSELNSC